MRDLFSVVNLVQYSIPVLVGLLIAYSRAAAVVNFSFTKKN